MHVIKDDQGNPVPHGAGNSCGSAHSCGEHGRDCGGCAQASGCGAKDDRQEALALLQYMIQHNGHHAAELIPLADNLEKLGMGDAANQLRESSSDFQKGNMRLSLALTLVKEHMKEA